MVDCAYCERPLTCDSCGADYRPATAEDHARLSDLDEPILCPACGDLLICRWCKTPYDGLPGGDED